MRISALILCSILGLTTNAQSVESTTFEFALWSVLDKGVPTIGVDNPIIKKAILIDARSEEEFTISHLKNAIHLERISDTLNLAFPLNKKDNLVVYCSIGYRSENLCRELISAGYTNTYNLYGGIFEWHNRGNNVYRMKHTTDSIHAFNYLWGIFLEKGTKVY